MSDLLLPTLAMMGLTFAIGFFVAFVIKLIAAAADSLDFYSLHQKELLRLRHIKKIRQKVELLIRETPPEEDDFCNDKREDYSHGINREFESYRGYYHGVSPGASNTNILEYYYPQDTKMLYLQKQEEMFQNKNQKHSDKSAHKTR